jgi:PAS domain S-box-containing protein
MAMLRDLSLLIKITIIVASILLAFLVLCIYFDYRQQKLFVIEEAVEKARILASEAIQAREYLSSQLQAGQIELSEKRYEMIPVLASTRIGERVAQDLGYSIHQISDRYRNVKNAPDFFESEMLKKFYADSVLKEDYAITTFQGEPVLRYLQPFPAEQSCLECHGEPKDAPNYIKKLFPPDKDQAYNYKIGEIIGAASVTIPMEKLKRQIYANLRNDILHSAGIFLALITCLGILIRAVVTRPLGQLGSVIGDIVRTGRFLKKIPQRGHDEIGNLIEGFNQMIDRLRKQTEELKESESRFRVLTETASDGIISFLSNGQIILFNHQAERMFGYSKKEILGVSVDRLIHEDCTSIRGMGVEAYLKQEADKLVRAPHEFSGRRRDGSRIFLELSLSVADSDGHRFYTAILRERS